MTVSKRKLSNQFKSRKKHPISNWTKILIITKIYLQKRKKNCNLSMKRSSPTQWKVKYWNDPINVCTKMMSSSWRRLWLLLCPHLRFPLSHSAKKRATALTQLLRSIHISVRPRTNLWSASRRNMDSNQLTELLTRKSGIKLWVSQKQKLNPLLETAKQIFEQNMGLGQGL